MNGEITIWHDNGPKYFRYLEERFKVTYKNIYFFRYWLGKNKTRKITSNFKLPILNDVNLICLAPFDLNIVIFILYKVIIKPDAKLILHTSTLDHSNGYFFKNIVFKKIWYYCVKRYFASIITPIPSLVSHLIEIYDKEVNLVTHPVDLPKANTLSSDRVGRKIKIGFLGEVSLKKGIDRFVRLSYRMDDTRFHFNVAGENIDNIIIPDRITYHGTLDKSHVKNYLDSLDLLCVPSRRTRSWEELFGIVIIEALSCGCRVVATDHIGPRDIRDYLGSIQLIADDDNSWALSEEYILNTLDKRPPDHELINKFFSPDSNIKKIANVCDYI